MRQRTKSQQEANKVNDKQVNNKKLNKVNTETARTSNEKLVLAYPIKLYQPKTRLILQLVLHALLFGFFCWLYTTYDPSIANSSLTLASFDVGSLLFALLVLASLVPLLFKLSILVFNTPYITITQSAVSYTDWTMLVNKNSISWLNVSEIILQPRVREFNQKFSYYSLSTLSDTVSSAKNCYAIHYQLSFNCIAHQPNKRNKANQTHHAKVTKQLTIASLYCQKILLNEAEVAHILKQSCSNFNKQQQDIKDNLETLQQVKKSKRYLYKKNLSSKEISYKPIAIQDYERSGFHLNKSGQLHFSELSKHLLMLVVTSGFLLVLLILVATIISYLFS